jgi:hypothetical protein
MAEQTIPIPSRQQVGKATPRAWVRYSRTEDVWCQSSSAPRKDELDTAWLGKIQDISPDGLGLNMRQRFEPGTELTIELTERP